jgi:hypothetical protein
MNCHMDKIESQVLPAPPNVLSSLRFGFDSVANRILIISLPIVIDLLLWLGPHLQVKTLMNDFLNALISASQTSSIQSGDIVNTSKEVIQAAAERINLFGLIRTIPVGIPSLMAARSPTGIPAGGVKFLDVANPYAVIGIAIGILLVGIFLGSLYYILVGQIALEGRIDLTKMLKNWSWSTLQVISLVLALLLLFVVISIPSSCVISAITLSGLPLSQFAIILYFGALLWLAFPLLFSAHGIFVNHNHTFVSVQRSMLLTRMTLPTTSLFILLVLVISEGFNMLWRVPPETSWLTLVGIGGHAYITSSLLAASFVYYRDADRWTQQTLKMIRSKKEKPV